MDKMEKKLPIGQGKYVTTTGRVSRIKSVTFSQDIYHLNVLIPPESIMAAIRKLECAFLWAASDKVSGGGRGV